VKDLINENPAKDPLNETDSSNNLALPSDYRIIVLFRDPRAVINSIRNSPDAWQKGNYSCELNTLNLNTRFRQIQDF
jgi:hypothetical protein